MRLFLVLSVFFLAACSGNLKSNFSDFPEVITDNALSVPTTTQMALKGKIRSMELVICSADDIDKNGQPREIPYQDVYLFDTVGRILQQRTVKFFPDGDSVVNELNYEYTNGLLAKKIEFRAGVKISESVFRSLDGKRYQATEFIYREDGTLVNLDSTRFTNERKTTALNSKGFFYRKGTTGLTSQYELDLQYEYSADTIRTISSGLVSNEVIKQVDDHGNRKRSTLYASSPTGENVGESERIYRYTYY